MKWLRNIFKKSEKSEKPFRKQKHAPKCPDCGCEVFDELFLIGQHKNECPQAKFVWPNDVVCKFYGQKENG